MGGIFGRDDLCQIGGLIPSFVIQVFSSITACYIYSIIFIAIHTKFNIDAVNAGQVRMLRC